MNINNKDIGQYGENLTAHYLSENGHIILSRNFKTRNGEIDIISKFNNIIIFTEVKSRYSKEYGYPSEAVTSYKKKTIKNIAKFYIYKYRLYDFYIRFDVSEVYFNYINNNFRINIIKDAFR